LLADALAEPAFATDVILSTAPQLQHGDPDGDRRLRPHPDPARRTICPRCIDYLRRKLSELVRDYSDRGWRRDDPAIWV
jgi:hypothetical protein